MGVNNIMDYNLRAFVVCLLFVISVNILAWVFYNDAVTSPFSNTSFIGGIEALSFLWLFADIFLGMIWFTLPVSADFPLVLSVLILFPYYGAVLYMLAPILERIGTLIINGIDAIIPG